MTAPRRKHTNDCHTRIDASDRANARRPASCRANSPPDLLTRGHKTCAQMVASCGYKEKRGCSGCLKNKQNKQTINKQHKQTNNKSINTAQHTAQEHTKAFAADKNTTHNAWSTDKHNSNDAQRSTTTQQAFAADKKTCSYVLTSTTTQCVVISVKIHVTRLVQDSPIAPRPQHDVNVRVGFTNLAWQWPTTRQD